MHESLTPELAEALQRPLPPPVTPMLDVHMHSGSVEATSQYVAAARRYGVDGACNMLFEGVPDPMRENFGDFFHPVAWPRVNPEDGREPGD